ncbi:MAG: ComEC/Rec2 family competence protein [Bacteroidales bacterium]|nr:ComEC/Rec2 family competence protein [Bacteroidales bacterium]
MWSQMPLVRLIIPVIAGILLAEYAGNKIHIPAYLIIVMGLIAVAGSFFYGLMFGYKRRWIFGLLIILFMSGYACRITKGMHGLEKKRCAEIADSTRIYIGVVEQAFQLRERSCKGIVRLIAVADSLNITEQQGMLVVYTQPDSILSTIQAGRVIIMQAGISRLKPPANPSEFDYRKYLSRKGIYHSAFLKKGQWEITGHKTAFRLRSFAEGIRKKLLKKLADNGIKDDHFGVSAALLLGQDDYLNNRLREMYASAGAMHILCVSGLHVGVIYLVLNFLLGFLRHVPAGRIMLPAVLIFSIWMYALITGLAPPVMRASIMISFIILGNMLKRHKNVYNTLAASAFLMLLFNPFVLFSAGFQLSYTAVIGIVSFQKPIYNLAYIKYKLPDKLWALTAVSIAAQLGTLPVIMYYFHQFPVYSLLTNLFVIPLSSLIIYAGLFLFLLPSLPYVTGAAATLLDSLILLMDYGISFIEALPYGVIRNISIDLVMLGGLYLIMISLALYFMRKRNTFFILGMVLIFLFSCYRTVRNYRREMQQHFFVYQVNGHSAYDVVRGRQHCFYADSILLQSEAKIEYSIRPNWLEMGLGPPRVIQMPALDEQKQYPGGCSIVPVPWLSVVVWSGRLPPCRPPKNKLKPGILILRGRCPYDFNDLLKWFDPGTIILDASVPPWVNAPEGDRRFWVVRNRGAYINGRLDGNINSSAEE